MKNALVIMNGTFMNHQIINSAINIAKATSSKLHAVFLTQDLDAPESEYLFPNDMALTQNKLTGKSIAEENEELVSANIRLFRDKCEAGKTEYIIEPDTHIPLKKLIGYSAFFDFLLAETGSSLGQYRLSDLLADAHCPVMLTNGSVDTVKRVIFSYDGSNSSLYAIKMYSYLFPEWNSIKSLVVYCASEKDQDLPFEERIRGLMSCHYQETSYHILTGKIHDSLIGFINSASEDTIVILGAYGRSNLSRMLHKSLADVLIEKTRASLFIVHE